MFELPPKIPFKAQYSPLKQRFWIMSEIEATFKEDGSIAEFRVIRSFKRMAEEDKKPKVAKEEEPKQRKTEVEEDETI